MPLRRTTVADSLSASRAVADADLTLQNGSRVAVIGGGPAGSFFTYFLLKMAAAVDLELDVDIYEPRSFTRSGPAGCNHCGGIVSESLVQILAAEGINLPGAVVQSGIESYVVHMDVGSVNIASPAREQRIAALYRGNGPRGGEDLDGISFDGYLQQLAVEKGARVVRKLVAGVAWKDGYPWVREADGRETRYDLVTVASGVNSNLLDLFADLPSPPGKPKTTRTYICEFRSTREQIQRVLGKSMHVFLLDIPRLEFAAIIPKGDFVTMCMLGDDLDQELVHTFLRSPVGTGLLSRRSDAVGVQLLPAHQHGRHEAAVRGSAAAHRRFRGDPSLQGRHRRRVPHVEGGGAHGRAPGHFGGVVPAELLARMPEDRQRQRDRQGDLRDDHGVQAFPLRAQSHSADDDARAGEQWRRPHERDPVEHVHGERTIPGHLPRHAPPRIHRRSAVEPVGRHLAGGERTEGDVKMGSNELGSLYASGEPIVRQGDLGDCMYVVQSGEVEVVQSTGDGERRLAILKSGDFFGEMAVFEHEVRSATVRASGEARVLKVDKRTLMRRMKEDPLLAFNLLQTMSRRIRKLSAEAAGRQEVGR